LTATSHRYRVEPRAVQLAKELHDRWGMDSVGHAHFQFLEATRLGKIARADLYHAVWSVLQHSHSVTATYGTAHA
jgi:hypothetical protein